MSHRGWQITERRLPDNELRVEFTSPDGITLFQPVTPRDTIEDTIEYVKRRIEWLSEKELTPAA